MEQSHAVANEMFCQNGFVAKWLSLVVTAFASDGKIGTQPLPANMPYIGVFLPLNKIKRTTCVLRFRVGHLPPF